MAKRTISRYSHDFAVSQAAGRARGVYDGVIDADVSTASIPEGKTRAEHLREIRENRKDRVKRVSRGRVGRNALRFGKFGLGGLGLALGAWEVGQLTRNLIGDDPADDPRDPDVAARHFMDSVGSQVSAGRAGERLEGLRLLADLEMAEALQGGMESAAMSLRPKEQEGVRAMLQAHSRQLEEIAAQPSAIMPEMSREEFLQKEGLL